MGLNKKRRALVTGGSRGIGLAIARKLAAEGMDVEITGKRAQNHTFEGFRYHRADFEQSAESLLALVGDSSFDVLVNNAGINKIHPFLDISPSEFDAIQQVNVRVPFRLCQWVLPHMLKQGWGRIINIGSIFGLVSKEQRASYSASKFALEGFSKALAIEVASQGVLVNCVLPGFIHTELTERVLGPNGMETMAAQVPMKRLGQPEEVAELVAWLSSDRNTFLTGQNIVVDGGFTCV